jgi:hypothetical protein
LDQASAADWSNLFRSCSALPVIPVIQDILITHIWREKKRKVARIIQNIEQ